MLQSFSKESKLSFHKFLNDKALCKKCVVATKGAAFVPKNETVLCSKHFLKSYFISGSGGNIGLATTQYHHVFNKYTNPQSSQTKIMEMLLKKMCWKIECCMVVGADDNDSNIQNAQNTGEGNQKENIFNEKMPESSKRWH